MCLMTISLLCLSRICVGEVSWGGIGEESFVDSEVDAYGNLYVVGHTSSYGSGKADVVIVKFSFEGKELWYRTWGSSQIDRGEAIAIDNESNAYIAGFQYDSSGVRSKVVVLKYNSTGSMIWQKMLDLGTTKGSKGLGIALNSKGNVIITGYQYGAVYLIGHLPKLIVINCESSTGNVIWLKEGGLIFNCGIGDDIFIDSNDNIYVCGYGPISDVILIKFNEFGEQQWANSWGVPC